MPVDAGNDCLILHVLLTVGGLSGVVSPVAGFHDFPLRITRDAFTAVDTSTVCS